MRRCPASDPGIRSHRIRPCGTLASVVRAWSAWSPAASASISTASGTNFPETRSGLMKRSASVMRRCMRNQAQCERALPSSWRSARNAADNRTFLAQGKLQMPVLAFGGEATFGPMIGAVMRWVADNVEDVSSPDCGHWITEEQPQATTDLVVDFLRRARQKAVPALEADARSGVS